MTIEELVNWCREEREDALRQIELFAKGGVKAKLELPDGSEEEITETLVRHQKEFATKYERLIAVLTK
ncbi:hypothetical protein [Aquisalinus flavus]|uniref:Uncharacterized protein n=1 Tax=Aquisalinus flavus TaxID=1526572 RepID=A0A8J2Y687_9PROT|nr:hypothetical protein [Aquisalinus flavus]MBD0427262.1 hypothetical protein [Aquisalinus flavus]UNE47076.1 hypothetical protein FF099_02875 [Aquisalinus flavus]GGC99593.1 hypothetical protein GCM10011342_05760 [Aquisalinus flavus]